MLGKITSVKLGAGGYDDAMFGFSFTLEGDLGCGDFWGTWSNRPDSAKWTVADQHKQFLESFLKVKQLMEDAKVDDFNDLVGKPIEVLWNGGKLHSWRILTEVV